MGNVQVKNVDPSVHDALRRRAAESGQSISDYVLELVRRDLRRPSKREWIDRARALRSTGRTSAEVREILDAGRSSVGD